MNSGRQPMTRACHPERAMHLPEGMTCADCQHLGRCEAIFGHVAADEVCDWAPSRFSPTDPDGAAGMLWWNTLGDDDRLFWMLASMGTSATDAWAYFKRCGAAGIASTAAAPIRSAS